MPNKVLKQVVQNPTNKAVLLFSFLIIIPTFSSLTPPPFDKQYSSI